jgi:hypothetical protein
MSSTAGKFFPPPNIYVYICAMGCRIHDEIIYKVISPLPLTPTPVPVSKTGCRPDSGLSLSSSHERSPQAVTLPSFLEIFSTPSEGTVNYRTGAAVDPVPHAGCGKHG